MPPDSSPHCKRTAGVVPAPLVFLAALLAGGGLQHWHPQTVGPPAATHVLGGVLASAGLCLSAWVTIVFARAGTPVSPLSPTVRLVEAGPFRWSRNPDYIGQSLLFSGIALLCDSAWMLALAPPALLFIRLKVVAAEEAYLAALFGDRYQAYCRRVRRW